MIPPGGRGAATAGITSLVKGMVPVIFPVHSGRPEKGASPGARDCMPYPPIFCLPLRIEVFRNARGVLLFHIRIFRNAQAGNPHG